MARKFSTKVDQLNQAIRELHACKRWFEACLLRLMRLHRNNAIEDLNR